MIIANDRQPTISYSGVYYSKHSFICLRFRRIYYVFFQIQGRFGYGLDLELFMSSMHVSWKRQMELSLLVNTTRDSTTSGGPRAKQTAGFDFLLCRPISFL